MLSKKISEHSGFKKFGRFSVQEILKTGSRHNILKQSFSEELGQVNSLKKIQKYKKNAFFNDLNLVQKKYIKKEPKGREQKQDSLRNRMFTFANNTEPVANFENILDEQKTTTTSYHLKKVNYF